MIAEHFPCTACLVLMKTLPQMLIVKFLNGKEGTSP